MAGYIEAMHDRMWRWAYPEHADALDGVTRPNGPPVFKRETATHNVPVPADAAKARAILSTVPSGKRHLWFRSTKSSQALAQGVFGALIAYDRLDVLAGVAAECGRPAFYADAAGWSLTLEHTVTTLAEPRPTSVDVLARGPGGCVAVECKLTEHDFGKCSRTRRENGRGPLCDGTYRHQQGRRTRCALTEIGIRYWDHLPTLFDWPAHRDHAPCPFGATYQLARNALAATVTADGETALNEGHALVIYDARNPRFAKNGTAAMQWQMAAGSCRVPGLLRRVSWQRIVAALARAPELGYLTTTLGRKYGLAPA